MSDQEASAWVERRKFMEVAVELLVVLRSITEPVQKLVNRLIESGDMLALDAADQAEEAKGTIVRRLKYEKMAAPGTPAPTVQAMDDAGQVVEKKQRKCGVCHKTGHNAKNCPKKGKS
jgi:hypothetical protein